MGKDGFRFEYDAYQAMANAPKLLGMELVRRGRQLEGQYYLNGDRHAYRRDKLKVYVSGGSVWVSEEGGESVSLVNWLMKYGGAADVNEAIRMIKGQSQAITWNHEVRERAVQEVKYVPWEAVRGAAEYDLNKCSLFRWMCTMFPEEKVREVWKEYNVTTDSHGNCVFWYQDRAGHYLFDKRILYKEDGHRDRTFFPGRQYRVADGYSGRCYFGSHLDGEVKGILESEKSCLYAACYYGGVWLATGGKNALRDVGSIPLYPDRDAEELWSRHGDCVDWYSDWPGCGDHSDLGDKIEWLVLRNAK